MASKMPTSLRSRINRCKRCLLSKPPLANFIPLQATRLELQQPSSICVGVDLLGFGCCLCGQAFPLGLGPIDDVPILDKMSDQVGAPRRT